MTSIGLGVLPSCITMFLWFQIVQRRENMDGRYSIFPWSICLKFKRMLLIQVCTLKLPKSEVWTARAEPCQQALAKVQWRNIWDVDSSSSLHKGQVLFVPIPLFFKIRKVGMLSCKILHVNKLTLYVTFTFQMRFHTSQGIRGGLRWPRDFKASSLRSILYAFFTTNAPEEEFFQKNLSATTLVFDKGILRILEPWGPV